LQLEELEPRLQPSAVNLLAPPDQPYGWLAWRPEPVLPFGLVQPQPASDLRDVIYQFDRDQFGNLYIRRLGYIQAYQQAKALAQDPMTPIDDVRRAFGLAARLKGSYVASRDLDQDLRKLLQKPNDELEDETSLFVVRQLGKVDRARADAYAARQTYLQLRDADAAGQQKALVEWWTRRATAKQARADFEDLQVALLGD